MNTSYRFTIGDLEFLAVADGSNLYQAETLFANVPRGDYQQALTSYGFDPESLDIPYTPLAVNVHGRWVLVDTGAGQRDSWRTGYLEQNLTAAGVEAAEIELVILTHGHTDHIGGLTDSEGMLRFKNARYVMAQKDWDFWRSKDNLEEMGWESIFNFINGKLGSIEQRVELLNEESELLPGVQVIPADGHTPGHMIVKFSSQGDELWSVGDALIHPLHLQHLDWYTVFDLDPQGSLATRLSLLNEVGAEVLIHAFHFPFPGIGRVIRCDTGWEWVPTG